VRPGGAGGTRTLTTSRGPTKWVGMMHTCARQAKKGGAFILLVLCLYFTSGQHTRNSVQAKRATKISWS